ncbi:uncharacterized protein LOC124820897 [Vigna umbellata]|uniref:uncharacterized protein LOC124820897 n=1 Tax=Vigna umbellata TaxID=87088 RepID=UPI001F5ED1AE|nr:uncharacterized protein LOC124820897 [Vigna umbellata]
MQLAQWRNLSSLKTRVIPSLSHFSEFHSTPCTCQNWKNKFSSHIGKGQQQPSKSQIKFITRQKRADAKKALNSLLYNSGSSKFSFEYEGLGRHSNKGQSKSGQRSGGKPQKKTKREFFFSSSL